LKIFFYLAMFNNYVHAEEFVQYSNNLIELVEQTKVCFFLK